MSSSSMSKLFLVFPNLTRNASLRFTRVLLEMGGKAKNQRWNTNLPNICWSLKACRVHHWINNVHYWFELLFDFLPENLWRLAEKLSCDLVSDADHCHCHTCCCRWWWQWCCNCARLCASPLTNTEVLNFLKKQKMTKVLAQMVSQVSF